MAEEGWWDWKGGGREVAEQEENFLTISTLDYLNFSPPCLLHPPPLSLSVIYLIFCVHLSVFVSIILFIFV